MTTSLYQKKVREKSRECHNHKPQPFPDPNTLIQELGSTKTYERIFTDERFIVNTHFIDITAKFAVSIKEKQDRLPN